MSNAWAGWVIGLIILNLGVTFSLLVWAPWARIPTVADGTTGHSWAHGAIREGLHQLPRWWLLLSWGMFLGCFGYFVLYPGLGNYPGLLGWTSINEHDQAAQAHAARLEPLWQRLNALTVDQLALDPQAQQWGRRLFMDNCAACHGAAGTGNHTLGAPNLTDGDWLYGGSTDAIIASIHDGRGGVMPAWNSLGDETVAQLVEYVRFISAQPHDANRVEEGKKTFATVCSACHGLEGKGNQQLGAPNLTDTVWLYGGDRATLRQTIYHGRQGHMPAWSPRLADQEIHVLAGYVRHLAH